MGEHLFHDIKGINGIIGNQHQRAAVPDLAEFCGSEIHQVDMKDISTCAPEFFCQHPVIRGDTRTDLDRDRHISRLERPDNRGKFPEVLQVVLARARPDQRRLAAVCVNLIYDSIPQCLGDCKERCG